MVHRRFTSKVSMEVITGINVANMASRPRDEIDELDVQVPLKLLHHSGLPQQVEPEKGKGDLNDVDDDDGDDDRGKYYMEGGRAGELCLRPPTMVTICSLRWPY